ncbi:MAG: PAS domain S-box protein [Promethearchaeota archaeon]
MTSLELNVFSPSETILIKSLLKNPDEDFEKIASILEQKARENSIQRKELDIKYRYFIENSIEGVWVIDENADTILVNPSMASMLGYEIEEMVGQSIFAFMDEDSFDITRYHLERRKKGISEEHDAVLLHKTGKNIHLRIKATPIFNDGDQYEGTYAFLTDITDQFEAEQKLKESEEKYRSLFENMNAAFAYHEVIVDNKNKPIDYKYIEVNPKFEELTGLKKEDLIGKRVTEAIPGTENDPADWIGRFGQVGLTGVPLTVEDYSKAIQKWFKVSGYSPKKGYFAVTFTDITDRKNTEQKIKESEENFRTIAEDSHLAITILQDDLVVYTNQKMADMFGYNREEMLTWTPKEYAKTVAEESLEFVMEQARKKQIGDPDITAAYPIHCVNSSGEKFWVDNISTTIMYNGRPADLVTLIDTTEKREAEQKLKESEEKFRTLTEQSFLGITILQNNIVKYVNEQLADIFGYTIEEIMNWSQGGFINVILPEDRQFVSEQARKKQLGESDVINQYEFRGIKKNGDMIWLELFSKTINYKGELADFVAIHDITNKKISEQKLIESEEKFRKITEESLLAICIIQDNVIKYVNHEMATLYGYTEEEMYNWVPGELLKTVTPDSLEIVKEQLRKKQVGDPDVIINYPIQIERKNGELFWVDNLSKTMMYEGRPANLVTQIDITERVKAQQELIKLNQLKSELLRRTSHELKTPLVSIKGFTELLLKVHRDKIDYVVISTLNEIMQGCIRLENLIGDILKTAELESGTIKLKTSKEDLSFLVRVCVNEIKGFSKLRNHSINLELPDNLMTLIEKEQIHQVISNLLNNAVKYTPPGGLIEISSEIKDNLIIVSIKDNGIGFTEEEKGMIFKQFGKIERYGQGLDIIAEGSGFGLFISKKIIELHGGDIWVESEGRNKGSTFYLSLPLV